MDGDRGGATSRGRLAEGARSDAAPIASSKAGASPRRVFVLGGTGTIGRATVRALVSRGYEVVCLVRRGARMSDTGGQTDRLELSGAAIRYGDVTDPASLAQDGFCGERFDVLISCLASRTGAPRDAWAIDYRAHMNALDASKAAGVTHVILLSAIFVQKPVLAFQHAKLAFETVLIRSGIDYTIVRPTAYFKSLSGQVERLKRRKSFIVFGNGMLTACKPISNDDLGSYIADCIDDEERRNRVLPIGGPGAAITPKAQGEQLFELLGCPPRFTHVPVVLLDVIVTILRMLGRLIPAIAVKAELARIGRYYATESMLVLDPTTGLYDAGATPSTGTDTLFDYYARLIRDEARDERGDHKVF